MSPQTLSLVICANVELERHEFPPATGDYFKLSALANETNATGRADIAEAIFCHGGPQLKGSRAMDNCFENGDSDRVVVELCLRARKDAVLHHAIANDFGGTFPDKWLAKLNAAMPTIRAA